MLTNLNDLRLKLRLASKALLLASCVALVGGLSGCGDACEEYEEVVEDCCNDCGGECSFDLESYDNNQVCSDALDLFECPCN